MEQLPSEKDLEDAEDILFAHPPRRIIRWYCACGNDYPCAEVHWAHLVKGMAEAPR